MNTKTFSNALGKIGDKYITEANEYTAAKKNRHWNWRAIAACAAVVTLIFGAIPFLNSDPAVSPFVLTAYALESDNSLSAVTMQEGENIPVSLFKADNGLWGFVFSYEAGDPEQPISVSIINADQQSVATERIETITGLEMEQGKDYVFYIPPQNEAGPYSLPLTLRDEDTSTVALLTVVIEQAEDGYTARIDTLTTYERKEAP